MSSGSKGPDKGHPSEPAQKREPKLTAEKIVEDRELRNTRAKTNMMLYEHKKALAPKVDEDFGEPGMAMQLLKKEKEYGAWAGEDDPHGLAAMEHDDAPGMDEDLAEEEVEEEQDALPDDEAEAEPTDEGANDEAEAAEPVDKGTDDAAAAQPMDDWYSKGKQRGHKGGKGKWQQKPWWSKAKWSNQKGRAGRKGQGKGVYDEWGGEYCHGGYRAVNGQFYPHLVFVSGA